LVRNIVLDVEIAINNAVAADKEGKTIKKI